MSNLWQKLAKSKNYRAAFVASYFKRSIPFKIIALLKKRGWSQEQLAEAAGLTQGVISRAANPNYGNLTVNTILRVAAGFDVAFVGEFVPFSEFAKRIENLSEDINLPTFDEENQALSSLSSCEQARTVPNTTFDAVALSDTVTVTVIRAMAQESVSGHNELQSQNTMSPLRSLGSVNEALNTRASLGHQEGNQLQQQEAA